MVNKKGEKKRKKERKKKEWKVGEKWLEKYVSAIYDCNLDGCHNFFIRFLFLFFILWVHRIWRLAQHWQHLFNCLYNVQAFLLFFVLLLFVLLVIGSNFIENGLRKIYFSCWYSVIKALSLCYEWELVDCQIFIQCLVITSFSRRFDWAEIQPCRQHFSVRYQ